MPGKGGRFLQMRSCNTERYAFGGGEEFISLIQKCYAPKKARKHQNKDFIKAVRGGGGVTIL